MTVKPGGSSAFAFYLAFYFTLMKLNISEKLFEISLDGKDDCIKLAAMLANNDLKVMPLILCAAFFRWAKDASAEDIHRVLNDIPFFQEVLNFKLTGERINTIDFLLHKAEEANTGAERLDR